MPTRNQWSISSLAAIAATAVLLIPESGAAQHGPPADTTANRARAAVAAMGTQWNADVLVETARLYTEVHRKVESPGIERIPDLSYGPDDRQKFDLFVPEQGFSEPGPIFVFLHGDGLPGGDKIVGGSESLLYSNVAKFAAYVGAIGINANYRLSPNAEWPSGAEDVRMLLAWIHQNIEAYGGDINTIVLIGNSLGATHIATYLFHEPSQLDGGPGVAAVVLSSGAFDDAALSEVAPDYFARRDARSMPLALVETYQGQRVPTLLWNAEYDMPSIQTSVARMYAALCEKYNGCPMFAQLYGFNHVSHIMSIGSEDNGAMNAIMRFYHSVR